MSWFERLPIHRKLVAIALVVTTAALMIATFGLIAFDFWSYRRTTIVDTTALANVLAENTAAAVMFSAPDDAQQSLATVQVRPTVRRACLYLPSGVLFAGYARSTADVCPPTLAQTSGVAWDVVTGTSAIRRNDQTHGTIYVERHLSDIWMRAAVSLIAGVVVLLLSGAVALLIAHRLHRTVSKPIVQLAQAARAIQPDGSAPTLPPIRASLDEVGDLVRSFSDMLERVKEANATLHRKEVERESLLAREREASRLKDEFLATVSHELRTPLNAIVGWVQLLGSSQLDEATRARAIESIARNAHAQARVIEDLVDVSRIVTGKLHLRFSPVDLRDAVDAAVEVVRPAAQARNVTLVVDTPTSPALVRGDRDRLQQVVWNLLSNAVKFTGTGGTVHLSVVLVDSSYELRVTDSGAGIAPDFLPFVFDRFRQADGSTTRTHGGLGLGLAIVKELTELHGGSVSASSGGPGQGSAFAVRIPALTERQPPPLRGAVSTHDSKALEGVSVLVVDDNEDALDLMTVALSAAGARVRTASSGAAALAAWRAEPAQLLLCDLAMPDIDGLDVLRRIRAIDAEAGRFTPAVAISAHASGEHMMRSAQAGFARHLTKPCDTAALVHTLCDVIARPGPRPVEMRR